MARYSVHCITFAQFNSNPNTSHWTGVLHLIRYLKTTASLGLRYGLVQFIDEQKKIFGLDMNGYADVNWGSCEAAGRRSCTGYLFKFGGGGAVTSTSKLQNHPALSSTNAEHVAALE
jgi:hypothetical protein